MLIMIIINVAMTQQRCYYDGDHGNNDDDDDDKGDDVIVTIGPMMMRTEIVYVHLCSCW